MNLQNLQELPSDPITDPSPEVPVTPPVPIPSSAFPTFKQASLLTPVVCDERAIGRLLETLLHRSGMSIEEAARRLGVTSNTIRQYLSGRRTRPSLLWFVRLAALCGAKVTVEYPR